MRLGVLVSGRGSNLEAVLEAVAAGRLAEVEPVLVVSNRPGVRALDVAARHDVSTLVMRRADFADVDHRDAAIGRSMADARADLVLLAGFDRLLRPPYFETFTGRTINIHPSLLPRHGGSGMIGLAVHAAVVGAGDRETGVTIHVVTPELDAGPAVGQVRVPVRGGESPEELAERVLGAEHRLLVEVLGDLAARGSRAGASASMTAASAVRVPPAPGAGAR